MSVPNASAAPARPAAAFGRHLAAYLEVCKPKVVTAIVFTAVVGMFLAVPGMVPVDILLAGTIGIGLGAAAGAAFNHAVERRIDAAMARTRNRPVVSGILAPRSVTVFACILAAGSAGVLLLWVNWLTAALTLVSTTAYAVVYTVWLKPATPQNIVIGGAAGAMPPVIGWAAVTGAVDPHSLLLFLIIFAWTPPHFWALAIHRRNEYAAADVPMLPVTHGVAFTRLQILLYTLLLLVASLLPYVTRMSGIVYLAGAVALGAGFVYYALALMFRDDPAPSDANVRVLDPLSVRHLRLPAGGPSLPVEDGLIGPRGGLGVRTAVRRRYSLSSTSAPAPRERERALAGTRTRPAAARMARQSPGSRRSPAASESAWCASRSEVVRREAEGPRRCPPRSGPCTATI